MEDWDILKAGFFFHAQTFFCAVPVVNDTNVEEERHWNKNKIVLVR